MPHIVLNSQIDLKDAFMFEGSQTTFVLPLPEFTPLGPENARFIPRVYSKSVMHRF